MPLSVGIVGQIVHDTILGPGDRKTEDFGGLLYTITALDAGMGPGDAIRPVTRVGSDLHAAVMERLSEMARVETDGVIVDPVPNNRVTLRYLDPENREERVSGGVGPLEPGDLGPLATADGLLINLVSGREASAGTLSAVIRDNPRPVHLDLHSYLLEPGPDGRHLPRRPSGWDDWLDLCDTLQLNRSELFTLAGESGEIFDIGGRIWRRLQGRRVSCLLVTVGAGGSWAWYRADDGGRRVAFIPALRGIDIIDPTGSGDVYGAAFFLARLRGEGVDAAMRSATRLAGINGTCAGTRGLEERLRSGRGAEDGDPWP